MTRSAFTSGGGHWALWAFGVGAMILESAVLADAVGMWMWALQTPLLLVIYVGLTRSFVPAAIMTAAWLPVADVLSGGPPGVVAFGLAGVFFAAQTAESRLRLPWGSGHWIVSVGAAILFAGLVTMSLLSLTAFADIRSAVLSNAVMSVVSTALLAWPAGRLLAWFDRRWQRGRTRTTRSGGRLSI